MSAVLAASAFEEAFGFTFKEEGGLSDRAVDRGGRTWRGLTQTLYDTWRTSQGLPTRPVEEADDAELRQIFHDEFWARCHCDSLPQMLATAVFDMAVMSGPGNAAQTLQRTVHVLPDGDIGPVTLAAVARTPDVVLEFLQARAGFNVDDVNAHPEQIANLHGWMNRILELCWIASRA